MVDDRAAEGAQQADHQGGAGGAVDVVVAEHADGFAVAHGVGQAFGGGVHVGQRRGVGQQGAQRRVEEIGGVLDPDLAGGQQAADDFRQAEALGDAECDAVLAGAPDPAPAAQAAADAEDELGQGKAPRWGSRSSW